MKIVMTILTGFASLVGLSFLLSWPVYMLWNGCLVDAIAGFKQVTWLQAWGITVLCALLFTTKVSKD
jgi:hypothetical protein